MFSKMALGAIWGYQQYLSPRKGFRCAYSVHHGGTGCSGYAKYAIREHGLWRALPFIQQRLRDCRVAYDQIRANCTCRSEPLDDAERAELERRRRKDKKSSKCDHCACADCAPMPSSCISGATRTGAGKNLDLNPCDGDGCGLDCGSADCASCDCGGCSCG